MICCEKKTGRGRVDSIHAVYIGLHCAIGINRSIPMHKHEYFTLQAHDDIADKKTHISSILSFCP